MLYRLLAATALVAIAAPLAAAPAKKSTAAATLPASNPFAKPSTLPFQAPDYARIKDRHYLPAMIAGMAQQKTEILAIANQKATPTFDNTLVAMERSGLLLERVQLAFGGVSSANTNATLQATDTKATPLLAAHNDFIYLNAKMFARVKALYDQRASLGLNAEQAKLLDVQYNKFVHSGAELSPARQAELKKLNLRIGTLQTDFGQKLLAATAKGALHVTDKAALAGLSDDVIAAAAKDAAARKLPGYLLPLQNTTQQPALESLTSRDTRAKLFEASLNRASRGDANDTRALIGEIAQLRAKQAALLGYKNFSAYTLYDQMAQTPEAANSFVDKLAPAIAAKGRTEAADIQKLVDAQNGGFKATAADWNFYADQIRKQRYALDSEQLKPYFEMDKVLVDGVFYAANQLYGLTFTERKDLPTWDPDMRVLAGLLLDLEHAHVGAPRGHVLALVEAQSVKLVGGVEHAVGEHLVDLEIGFERVGIQDHRAFELDE